MGTYLNPGNSGFARCLRSKYIDKTMLLDIINRTIDTPMNLTCRSCPRRFGKSYAAQMLCAYYDKSVDSHAIFDGLAISRTADYSKHLNQYNVIYLDMASIVSVISEEQTVPFIVKNVTKELCSAFPGMTVEDTLYGTLNNAVELTNSKFIVVIDEWDAPIREQPNGGMEYLYFLRSLFKNSGLTAKLFAAVYITGIFPIKKIKSQSALSDFEEYTMLDPEPFETYIGFTEEEVRQLCDQTQTDYQEMKRWYDGYQMLDGGSIYNPNSVMKAVRKGRFDSYWSQSSSADNLLDYISRDVAGLRTTILELMGGVDVEIDTTGYNNDLTYTTRDAALTMLVHLGYLSYNQKTKKIRIPNEEIRLEFARTIRSDTNPDTMKRVSESIQLIMDTVHKNSAAVAEQIRKVHMETTNPINANREDSLRAVIQVAYFAYKDYFIKLEELPTGKGYADIVYLPKHGIDIPALVVELKWNKDAYGAISQIKKNHYPVALEGYGGEILLVGINYDKKSKLYECLIEEWKR